MLSLLNDGRYPMLELTPQQRREATLGAEQRNAIGPLYNVLLDVCREQLVADDAIDCFDFAPCQPD
jgi:hypothetical protein